MTTFSFLHMDTAYIDDEVVELTDADREWMHRHYTAHIAAGVPADAAVTPVLAAWLSRRRAQAKIDKAARRFQARIDTDRRPATDRVRYLRPSGSWVKGVVTPRLAVHPTRYEFRPAEVFTGDPRESNAHYDPHAITVDWRGGDRWAVSLGAGWSSQRVWSVVEDDWVYEPLPSERDDEFYAATRFDLDQALALAESLANGVPS